MQDIRIHFPPSAGNGQFVALTDGKRQPIGIALPFTLLLDDDDYAKLRWYLEDYMALPDGGAVVRAQRIEAQLSTWGRQLHDAVFAAPENQAALQRLLAADEPRQLTLATSDPALLRLPWELMSDAAGSLALRVSIRRQLEAPEALLAREVQLPLRILYIVSRPEDAGFIDPRVTSKALLAAIDPLGAAVKLDFCRPPDPRIPRPEGGLERLQHPLPNRRSPWRHRRRRVGAQARCQARRPGAPCRRRWQPAQPNAPDAESPRHRLRAGRPQRRAPRPRRSRSPGHPGPHARPLPRLLGQPAPIGRR